MLRYAVGGSATSLLQRPAAAVLARVPCSPVHTPAPRCMSSLSGARRPPALSDDTRQLLRRAALPELVFLETVHKHPVLYQGDSELMKLARDRYLHRWLPLVAKLVLPNREHGQGRQDAPVALPVPLVPPLDIQWMWHTHMLAPTLYLSNTMSLIECTPDHAWRPLSGSHDDLERTAELWASAFPQEPFELSPLRQLPGDPGVSSPVGTDLDGYASRARAMHQHSARLIQDEELAILVNRSVARSLSSANAVYDLSAAAGRQSAFYHQVSLPHYKDPVFLDQALQRYDRFVRLKMLHPTRVLAPSYDIDLFWHTHMVHPGRYFADVSTTQPSHGRTRDTTMSDVAFHRVIPHDDTMNDRAENSTLSRAYADVRRLWEAEYKVPFVQPGAMWRGDPPPSTGVSFASPGLPQPRLDRPSAVSEPKHNSASSDLLPMPEMCAEDRYHLNVQLRNIRPAGGTSSQWKVLASLQQPDWWTPYGKWFWEMRGLSLWNKLFTSAQYAEALWEFDADTSSTLNIAIEANAKSLEQTVGKLTGGQRHVLVRPRELFAPLLPKAFQDRNTDNGAKVVDLAQHTDSGQLQYTVECATTSGDPVLFDVTVSALEQLPQMFHVSAASAQRIPRPVTDCEGLPIEYRTGGPLHGLLRWAMVRDHTNVPVGYVCVAPVDQGLAGAHPNPEFLWLMERSSTGGVHVVGTASLVRGPIIPDAQHLSDSCSAWAVQEDETAVVLNAKSRSGNLMAPHVALMGSWHDVQSGKLQKELGGPSRPQFGKFGCRVVALALPGEETRLATEVPLEVNEEAHMRVDGGARGAASTQGAGGDLRASVSLRDANIFAPARRSPTLAMLEGLGLCSLYGLLHPGHISSERWAQLGKAADQGDRNPLAGTARLRVTGGDRVVLENQRLLHGLPRFGNSLTDMELTGLVQNQQRQAIAAAAASMSSAASEEKDETTKGFFATLASMNTNVKDVDDLPSPNKYVDPAELKLLNAIGGLDALLSPAARLADQRFFRPSKLAGASTISGGCGGCGACGASCGGCGGCGGCG